MGSAAPTPTTLRARQAAVGEVDGHDPPRRVEPEPSNSMRTAPGTVTAELTGSAALTSRVHSVSRCRVAGLPCTPMFATRPPGRMSSEASSNVCGTPTASIATSAPSGDTMTAYDVLADAAHTDVHERLDKADLLPVAGRQHLQIPSSRHVRNETAVAQSVHLGCFGLFFASLALAIGGATGQKQLAVGGAAGAAVVMFLVNGFAPVVPAIEFLRYGSAFYYANGSDPITTGFDAGHLLVLLLATAAMVAVAALTLRGRDLRA